MGLDPMTICYLLILVNVLFSIQGFNRYDWKEKYVFSTERILLMREYYRIVSSAFLHANWLHLLMNMLVLYMFSPYLSYALPVWGYILVYFGSMIGGNLLSLYIHRNQSGYRALGASGAVNGVIFASIALFPNMTIWFFIPGWIFGIIYVLGSIYAIRNKRDNVGHDAHLGGAIVGILIAVALRPEVLAVNGWIILAMVLPAAIFLYLIVTRPEILILPLDAVFPVFKEKPQSQAKIRDLKRKQSTKNAKFRSPEEEINFLLDKGVENLSPKEKKRLDELSGNIRE
ncbi:MAG: rhomboid family intramembrane serine protease [Bacteroidota bacterium]